MAITPQSLPITLPTLITARVGPSTKDVHKILAFFTSLPHWGGRWKCQNMDLLQFYSRRMFNQITCTDVYYYFWQPKTGFSPHAHHQHIQTQKRNTYKRITANVACSRNDGCCLDICPRLDPPTGGGLPTQIGVYRKKVGGVNSPPA